MEEVSPQALLLARRDDAFDLAKQQRKTKNRCIGAFYVFGFMGLAGGAIAAATAAAEGVPTWIPVAAGVLAAVGGGASAGFRLETRAHRHALAAANLKAVADMAANEHAKITATGGTANDAISALCNVQRCLDAAREQTVIEPGEAPSPAPSAPDS
jgi:hypothetical protein